MARSISKMTKKELDARLRTRHKFDLGSNGCGNCRLGIHKRCRPKLDGTLCSCNCPTAVTFREEVAAFRVAAENKQESEPSVEAIYKEIKPKSTYRKLF